ncbi:MAG: hypothetical protein R2705_02345 [Ilumatobacteraceae bacterium]
MSDNDPALPSHATAWRRRLPLLPALIFTIVLTQVPFVMSIYYSLTNWKINPPTPRVHRIRENFSKLIHNQPFIDAAWVSVKMTVLSVVLSLLLGTLLALLLDRKFGQGVVRPLLITPFLDHAGRGRPHLEEPDVPWPLRRQNWCLRSWAPSRSSSCHDIRWGRSCRCSCGSGRRS